MIKKRQISAFVIKKRHLEALISTENIIVYGLRYHEKLLKKIFFFLKKAGRPLGPKKGARVPAGAAGR